MTSLTPNTDEEEKLSAGVESVLDIKLLVEDYFDLLFCIKSCFF